MKKEDSGKNFSAVLGFYVDGKDETEIKNLSSIVIQERSHF